MAILYVCERERTAEREHALIEATLEALWRSPGVQRVEAQLLLLDSPLERKVPFASRFQPFPRRFLEALGEAGSGAPKHASRKASAIAPWTEAQQDDSARLVAAAYRGHVDSEINDQYRSPSGSRRFLNNIVQYPGCGTFFAPASFRGARDAKGALCGMSLASLVSDTTGHITQICVAPAQRGKGVGYALLRRSMLALAAHGCRTVGLTVTSKNTSAIRLYEQMGFTDRREFAAYVWDCLVNLASAGAPVTLEESLWRGFRGNGRGQRGREKAKSASAPRVCGSSARAAARSSGRKPWKRTGRCARSAITIFAWMRATRLALLFDGGTYEEVDASLTSTDPLHFSDSKTYAVRLS